MLEQEITPHPEQQRNLAALREEFRATNQQRIHDQLLTHPVGWGVLGDPRLARDRFTSEEWAIQLLNRLDEPVAQDFGLSEVPESLGAKLEDLAQKALLHESVTWEDGTEGVVDHDAAPCDLSAMTDDQIADYVANAIEESKDAEI